MRVKDAEEHRSQIPLSTDVGGLVDAPEWKKNGCNRCGVSSNLTATNMRRYPSGEGIRLIHVNADGSIPSLRIKLKQREVCIMKRKQKRNPDKCDKKT